MFKKYGAFQLEKDDVSGPLILPPNLKGTKWKLESVYDKPTENHTIVDLMDYSLTLDTDLTGKIPVGIQFSGKEISAMLLDESGNDTDIYYGDSSTEDLIDPVDITKIFDVTSYSINEKDMKLYTSFDQILKY